MKLNRYDIRIGSIYSQMRREVRIINGIEMMRETKHYRDPALTVQRPDDQYGLRVFWPGRRLRSGAADRKRALTH